MNLIIPVYMLDMLFVVFGLVVVVHYLIASHLIRKQYLHLDAERTGVLKYFVLSLLID